MRHQGIIREIKELQASLDAEYQASGLPPGGLPDAIKSQPTLKQAAFMQGLNVVCGHCQALQEHVHSFFSVMDSVASPEAMVNMSAIRGFGGMGLSDHGTMGGVLRAGKAAKNWKVYRQKDTKKLVNVRSVDLSSKDDAIYLNSYILCDKNFTPVPEWDALKYVLTSLPKAIVERSPIFSDRFRIVPKGEYSYRQNEKSLQEEEILPLIESGLKLCNDSWVPLELGPYKKLLKMFPKITITHDESEPKRFRLYETPNKDKDIQGEGDPVSDFKVLAGIELYISWRADRGKRYNHVTVYATGQKGYRALVLLTTMGSIASRRYVGERGFFRPRVFVEDLVMAIKEAEGEIVVTTGCALSITSEALRAGDEAGAERFFDTMLEVLPKENFFAELHLCDTSVDWNRNYARAEDKFHSVLYRTPVSRFRHASYEEALDFSKTFQRELRQFVMGQTLAGYRLDHQGSPKDLFHESQFDLSTPENIALARQYQTSGIVKPLLEAGIFDDITTLFNHDDLESTRRLCDHVMLEAEELLAIGTTPDSPEEPRKTKKKGNVTYVKAKAGRFVQLLDEDSLVLLSTSLSVLRAAKEASRADRPRMAAAELLARLAIFVITRVAREDYLDVVNPMDVIRSFSMAPGAAALCAKDDAEVLEALAGDRLLMLDSVLSGETGQDLLFPAARALVALLRPVIFDHISVSLAPAAGAEDGVEREWLRSNEGNFVEKINLGLIKIAKKKDVPLIMATDAHMTTPEQKFVQDAVMKRGKRRAWHMSRPYAIPRSNLLGMLEDLGAEWTVDKEYLPSEGNSAFTMLEKGIVSLDDVVEAVGASSLLLERAKSVHTFKWKTAVPRIHYPSHPLYKESKELLESGTLEELLPKEDKSGKGIKFGEKSLEISTALVVNTFFKAIEDGIIPDKPEYWDRLLSELFLNQEVPHEKLADFFLILQVLIDRWRAVGVSVGPGRGSSGGMLTAMISGITYGDPIKKGFLEARWMNRGRKEKGAHADIDIDVSDRKVAGYELAKVARESFVFSVKEKPLSPLEEIVFAEIFYSSIPVVHELDANGRPIGETKKVNKDIRTGFLENVTGKKVKDLSQKLEEKNSDTTSEEEIDPDSADIFQEDGDGITVMGTPVTRVGAYQSLKAKAAVKEAVRLLDRTPFVELESFAEATAQYKKDNAHRFYISDGHVTRAMNDREINALYEEDKHGPTSHQPMSMKERLARRRVKLGDMLTKAMAAGAGLARLYQSEQDYFEGSVYGEVPNYWDVSARAPTGSPEARAYFERNPEVEAMVRDMLYIYKAPAVHAGGFCFGREVFERIPMRADKYGFITQFEMKDIEAVGILKFDVLGLETLNQVAYTYKFILENEPYENLSWWLPRHVWEKVKAGASTDYLWRWAPPSTEKAIDVFFRNRTGIFQVDTNTIGKVLDTVDPEKVKELIRRKGDPNDRNNEAFTDMINDDLALFRPGPMKLKAEIEYQERIMGKAYTIVHPWLEKFVADTLGLIVFQEQVMFIWSHGAIKLKDDGTPVLNDMGGFIIASDEDTDEVRRAMGKKDLGALKKLDAEGRFRRGLKAQGVPDDIALEIWKMIVPFAEYGFNKPHSYHYATISAQTCFLKAHYLRYFLRVTLGRAKPDDATRFIAEIPNTKAPCVMRSEQTYWIPDGDAWYTGLETIKGLKEKDILKIMTTQEAVKERIKAGETLTPELYFKEFGPLTKSLAALLAESGLLRILGQPAAIAEGYKAAIGVLKPAKKKKTKEIFLTAPQKGEKEAEETSVPEYDDLIFEPLSKEEETKDEETKDEGKEEDAPQRQPPHTAIDVKLGKTDQEVYEILRDQGMQFTESSGAASGEVLTVASALNMVLKNNITGINLRHLVAALAEADRREGNFSAPPYLTVKELAELTHSDGRPIETGVVYRTVAVPKGVSTTGYNGQEPEPRVAFTAEGKELRAKFTRDYDEERMTEDIDVLKKAVKAKIPFIIDVYVGIFNKRETGQSFPYYKIMRLEKMGGGGE